MGRGGRVAVKPDDTLYNVNIFRPKKGYMVEEVVVMFTILAGWAAMNFGFQYFLHLLATINREGLLTKFTLFGFPLHYWFTGQFLPLWFVLLCLLFNLYIDHLGETHRRRKERRS